MLLWRNLKHTIWHVFFALNADTKVCGLTELDMKQVHNLCNKKRKKKDADIFKYHEVTALKRSYKHNQSQLEKK